MLRSTLLRFGIFGLLAFALAVLIFSATASGRQPAQLEEGYAPLPIGTFFTEISTSDFSPAFTDELEDADTANYQGRWELTLDGQGHYTATSQNQLKIEGLYDLTTEQLVLYSGKWSASYADTGDMGRRPYHAPGLYGWNFDGKTFSLTVLSEECAIRKTLLQSHSLTVVAPN